MRITITTYYSGELVKIFKQDSLLDAIKYEANLIIKEYAYIKKVTYL
jgi:hypothetical protein